MKSKLVECLCKVNSRQASGETNENSCEEIFAEVAGNLDINFEIIEESLADIISLNFSETVTGDWKCICLSLYIIKLLNTELEHSDLLLSVQQSKDVRKCVRNLVEVGICSRLQPKLPFFIKSNRQSDIKDIFWDYNVLKCTTFALCEFFKSSNLRLLILPECLKEVLVALFQISFCPLKKPSETPGTETNVMTEDIYNKLNDERGMSLKILDGLRETIHPSIFVKELMVIFRENSPTWFKKAVSQSLTSIIRSKNGVESIAATLLGECENDSTKTWKILDIFSRLILSCRRFPDFHVNTCKQVVSLLEKTPEESSVYERLYAHCTKVFYKEDPEFAKNNFLRPVISFFIYFSYRDHKFMDGEDLTRRVRQNSRLLHAIFVQNSVESPALPFKVLKPVLNVLFRFYALTSSSPLTLTNNDLRAILLGFLRRYPEDSFSSFDSFLFDINTAEILPFRNDVVVQKEDERLILRFSEHSVIHASSENSTCLLELVRVDSDLTQKLFGFLLNCVSESDKYFKRGNVELLELEEEFMNQFFERKMTVYRLLSELSGDKTVQQELTKDPHDVIKYIQIVLRRTLDTGTHRSTNTDSDEFQSLFTILMILQSLLEGANATNIMAYGSLLDSLRNLSKEIVITEARDLIQQILDVLEGDKRLKDRSLGKEKTDLDKALEDICDPLLPVRGHGLMTLAKLVETKDKHAMDKRNYILNVFQQNLKNEDSFIYLSAIGGLASLADVFPDSVLQILCEEYSDSSRKITEDGHEVRMKLGECLVRVTKKLGDMAPKYKPLLLNTFLVGTKEDDDLIRASSLSNLGEICKVLGYKLGTIVTEVLVCVHAVIATDKSPQARRAAVGVIRQLFVGLEKETIAFLKDDILTIYRTLKDIYNSDSDDVMRLQSQLALEELNENMKSFVLAPPKLHDEKKIVVLK
nr:transport and Golgi organization protein 6 homolog [Leptinotarsa decemlineata]